MAFTYELFDRVGYIILEDGQPIEEELYESEWEAKRQAEARVKELEAEQ